MAQNDWIGGKREAYRRALEDALARIRQRLADIPEVRKAILFGSSVRGRRDLFTDLDLVVVMQSGTDFVQRWLAQAEADLKWAELLADKDAYHLACFHAQQVAELALKAFLDAQGEEIVLGHSVERLCASAAGYNPEFGERARS